MKKFLSILLAVITALSFSMIAFAYENVDNTFDNFTPAIGKEAPDNWYDPCCYDEEGLLRKEALSGGNLDHSLALYCRKYKRIFTTSCIGAITKNGIFYDPYSYKVPSESSYSGFVDLSYCPYCGEKECLDSNDKFDTNHIKVFSVAYGANCPDCGLHNINYNSFVFTSEENNGKTFCHKCKKAYRPEKFTRYISKEMLHSEYSFIFEETAYRYGDGKDCIADDLVFIREDDIFLHREDVPKKELICITAYNWFSAVYGWFDNLFNTIKGWFK